MSADLNNCGFYVCILHVLFLVGFLQISSQIVPFAQKFNKELVSQAHSHQLRYQHHNFLSCNWLVPLSCNGNCNIF